MYVKSGNMGIRGCKDIGPKGKFLKNFCVRRAKYGLFQWKIILEKGKITRLSKMKVRGD